MRASNLNRYYFLDLSTGNTYHSTFGGLTYHARPGSVLFENETHVGIVTHRDLVLLGRRCIDKIVSEWVCIRSGTVGIQLDDEALSDLSLIDRWVEDPASVDADAILNMPERGACPITGYRIRGKIRQLLIGAVNPDPMPLIIILCRLFDTFILIEHRETMSRWFLGHLRAGQ